MSYGSNQTPAAAGEASSCIYSGAWTTQQRNSWIQADEFYTNHITMPADGPRDKDGKQPLSEKHTRKNGNSAYKHVPHRDKPPQVVAKRNARERRRVQAVNSAFMRLRKAVPVENSRGKRISKVKTLQNAIEYIQRLQRLLQEEGRKPFINHSYSFRSELLFGDFDFEDEL